MLMPPLGLQPLSFTVTQLLQNKPGINLSTTLPFSSNTLHTKQTGLSAYEIDVGHPNRYISSGYSTYRFTIKKQNYLRCHRELIFLLLLLSFTANKLDLLEVSSLMSVIKGDVFLEENHNLMLFKSF